MTDHNITPPPDLVQQWLAEIWHEGTPVRVALSDEHIATRAAQWGADQELEACCEWLDGNNPHTDAVISDLRAARRPKPQTLNSIALEMLGTIERMDVVIPEITDTIRRALEQLDDRSHPQRSKPPQR
jgi:hypothetical protein